MVMEYTYEPSPFDYFPLDENKKAMRTTMYDDGKLVGFLDTIEYSGVLYKMLLLIEEDYRADRWIPFLVEALKPLSNYDKIVWVNVPENVVRFIPEYIKQAHPAHRYIVHGPEDFLGGFSYYPPRQ